MSSDLFKVLKKMMPGVVIFLIGLTYFYYLPANYDFDGVVFSQTLRTALMKNDLVIAIQAHHPLYFPVNFFIYKVLQTSVGYNVLEYFHLQLFSLFFGLFTLLFFYKIIKKSIDQIAFHYIGIILIAFCYGFWYYSVEAEVHIAALFFVTAGFYYSFFKHDYPIKLHQIALSALFFSLAAGFHLTNGLIAVSVCLIFLIEKRSFVKICQFLFFYLLFYVALVSIFFIFHKTNPIDLFRVQLFGKDVLSGYTINYWSDVSLATLWASLKSVAGGILFPATPKTAYVSLLLFFCALFFIFTAWYKAKEARVFYRLFLWMLPYFLFFSFWDCSKIEFKLNVLLPFIILFVLASSVLIRGKTRYLPPIIAVILVMVFNIHDVIIPAHNIENNRNYLVAKAVADAAEPDAIIIIAGIGTEVSTFNKIYLPYFAHRKTYILDWAFGKGLSLSDIAAQIKQKRDQGTPILFFSEVTYLSAALKKLLKNHNIKENDYFDFLDRLNLEENIPVSDGYYLKPVK